MKILLSAFACAPNKGSEPGVGWNWAISLSKENEVWVLTREENKEEIESYIKENPVPFHICYFGIEFFENMIKLPYRKNLYIMMWQKKVISYAMELNKKHNFDICHHITYATFKYPSQLYKLGIPFILGPVGGGERTPLSCRKKFSLKYKLIEYIHDFQINCSIKSKSFLKMCNHASKILVTTPETYMCFPKQYQEKLIIYQTIGISDKEILITDTVKNYDTSGPFRIAFVGNLLQLKGIRMLIDIAENLHRKFSFTFEIFGEGPERDYLSKHIIKKNLEEHFVFHGMLPRKKVLKCLDNMHLFIFPSYHDSGAMAVLEAMARRIPVLALGTGGPDVHIDKNNGIKIDTNQPYDVIVEDFACKICEIRNSYINEYNQIESIANNATEYLLSNCTWEKKSEFMNKLYKDVLKDSKSC